MGGGISSVRNQGEKLFMTTRVQYKKKLKPLSQNLRKQGVESEVKMWAYLKKNQVQDIRFYRQRPIGPYIVDFLCSKLKLVIEIDGFTHDEKVKYDEKRQDYLEKEGYCVLRFLDRDVFRNLEGIFEVIHQYVKDLKENPEIKKKSGLIY